MNHIIFPVFNLLAAVFIWLGSTAGIGQYQRPGISDEISPIGQNADTVPLGQKSFTKGKIIWFIVGDPSSLNISEKDIQSRLEDNGYKILITDDHIKDKEKPTDIALIIVSKTVNSLNVGNYLKSSSCGFMTWEDNLQMSQLMGYSENDGSQGTAWHFKNQDWYIVADAPSALSAGLSGRVRVYSSADEMTYSPNNTPVPSSANVVAEFKAGDLLKTYYVFEKGSILGDGTPAAGRRVYFGLYDDTFKLLNRNGLKLFDAAVEWASDN